ncbi:hypothetical protein PHPALM_31743 [Phytophthora palmivora]|uniref:Uncharacterized protein n=1 Tax=Phytophthora palmivora TaxID=4796 RepID=A0A2P4X1T8_9STRA|nr:hypothetical protein PHPALM_31743 [Phytophthora palmivora]
MSSKKNYLLLDWLDSQSIVSVLTLSLMGPRPLAGGHTSMAAYERNLIKGVSLFIGNIEAARLRKKSETKGGLHPVWGVLSVQPENTSSVAQVAGSLARVVSQGAPS